MQSSAVVKAFEIQAKGCESYGSPFYAGLLGAALADLASDGGLARIFAPWADADLKTWVSDAVLLRFLGSLHHLVLLGRAPELAAAFPPRGADGAAAWQAVSPLLASRAEEIASFMRHEPQTNEVNRSACILAGVQALGPLVERPLRLFELGASAGLNSMWDHFQYRLGDQRWGDHRAPVEVVSAWRGGPPPVLRPLTILEKRACDRRPVNVSDPDEQARLLAYVWPDQTERLGRLKAALELSNRHGVRVEQACAAEWVRDEVEASGGTTTILFHTIFWQYMAGETQQALLTAVERIGQGASEHAPFAWLRMEPKAGDMATIELRCRSWPDGDDTLLARAHPHGAWIEWV
jgi:hypothetical protein